MTNNFNKDRFRSIPILDALMLFVYEIVQSQDIFYIGFQPAFNECDIRVYEFRTFADIRQEAKRLLDEGNYPHFLKELILANLDKHSKIIERNIADFGLPHFLSFEEKTSWN